MRGNTVQSLHPPYPHQTVHQAKYIPYSPSNVHSVEPIEVQPYGTDEIILERGSGSGLSGGCESYLRPNKCDLVIIFAFAGSLPFLLSFLCVPLALSSPSLSLTPCNSLYHLYSPHACTTITLSGFSQVGFIRCLTRVTPDSTVLLYRE
jgi:hypothetical protein